MIDLTFKQALLLKYIDDYEGINGKVNLHKFIFALQEFLIINFGYIFTIGFFGPFCEELEMDINHLCEVGLLIEEPIGNTIRLSTTDSSFIKEFFENHKEVMKVFQENKLLEYKIVDLFENYLKTYERIELANSFIQLILSKEIRDKIHLFNAVDRWKPNKFGYREKEQVWDILLQNKIIYKNGTLKFCGVKNNFPKDIIESKILFKDAEVFSHDESLKFIGFDEMLNLVYTDSFWTNLIEKIINRTECKFWDFKQTLEMWKVQNSLRDIKQIDFCEKITSFANKKGGIIILGITDKIPRKIVGIFDLENKLQSISVIINKWIDYKEEFYEIREILLKDSNDNEKRCIAINIAQTKEIIAVKNLNGSYSYPIRLETGLYRENFSNLKKKKRVVPKTNFNFLNLLNNGL